jgi:hypothetical protein
LAPGLLSTITGCFHASDSFGARRRATVSMPPPGGKPMTMRTCRAGKTSWAWASGATSAEASTDNSTGTRTDTSRDTSRDTSGGAGTTASVAHAPRIARERRMRVDPPVACSMTVPMIVSCIKFPAW